MAATVHDWTRVDDATFHDFHNTWLVLLKVALNRGLLPPGYYAQVEQRANQYESDVPALERPVPPANGPTPAPPNSPPAAGAVAVADTPPAAAVHLAAPGRRPRSVAVRHVSGHRVAALIELTSPANKDRAPRWPRSSPR